MKWLKRLLFSVLLLCFSLSTLLSEVVLTDDQYNNLSTLIKNSKNESKQQTKELILVNHLLDKATIELKTANKDLKESQIISQKQRKSLEKLRGDDFLFKAGLIITSLGLGFMIGVISR